MVENHDKHLGVSTVTAAKANNDRHSKHSCSLSRCPRGLVAATPPIPSAFPSTELCAHWDRRPKEQSRRLPSEPGRRPRAPAATEETMRKNAVRLAKRSRRAGPTVQSHLREVHQKLVGLSKKGMDDFGVPHFRTPILTL